MRIAGLGAHAVVTTVVMVLGVVILGSCTSARAQEVAGQNGRTAAKSSAQDQKETQGKVRVTSNLVVLSVTVKNRDGELVMDAERNWFRLRDDGVEQSIDVFEQESEALSLVVLLDNELKAKEAGQMAESLRTLLASFSDQDEAMICRFDSRFYPGAGFTSDQDKLMAELKASGAEDKPVVPASSRGASSCGNSAKGCIGAPLSFGPQTDKALDDALFSAAELLEKTGENRRKMILVISDGANQPKLNQHAYGSVREKLLFDNIAVFALGLGWNPDSAKFSRLENYAHLSGGDFYHTTKSREMDDIYVRITEESRHQYILTYAPKGNDGTANYHRVELQILRDGLSAQTREGYYNDRPEEKSKQ